LIDSAANLVLEPTPEQIETTTQPEQAARPTPKPLPPGTYEPYVPYVPPVRPHKPAAQSAAPPDPLTTWYGKLTTLHHDNAVIRLGSKTFLDFDAQNALVWVNTPVKPSPTTPPVVVICNLSASPVQLSLTDAIKKFHLTGWFLRTLLRSDDAMGGQNLDSVSVPAYGVYIGELRR
jgi:alpha-glucosidase